MEAAQEKWSCQLSGMDRLTREHRSWNMSRITGRDTTPERAVRSYLHGQGLRFRLHRRDLPGRPDIVLSSSRTAVFVHGCFWHRHQGCKFAYTPKSNLAFWQTKFERNCTRDREVMRRLRALGWRAVVIWECQSRDVALLTRRLVLPHRRRTAG
jgi:DNA mismatch endonuclease (patch repair protein)